MRTNSNIVEILHKQTLNEYPLFAEYCHYLNKGLRKKALEYLDQFIENTKDWNFTKRSDFCYRIFNLSQLDSDFESILTTNLSNSFLQKTLLELTKKDAENYLPFLWYGLYYRDTSFIVKAHQLNSNNDTLKSILLRAIEKALWSSTHHLPDGYLGDIETDESYIKLANEILNSNKKLFDNKYTGTFEEFSELISEYRNNTKSTSH